MEFNSDEDIELAVHWLYRAEVKEPPDSMSELAKEAGASVADVREGIAEAKRLLHHVGTILNAGRATTEQH